MAIELPKTKRDMTGRRFGRLVAVEPVEIRVCGKNRQVVWRCRCQCGNAARVRENNLRSGHSKSCGCLGRERLAAPRAHGQTRSREYETWLNIKQRCGNPKHVSYERYGAIGIHICPEWQDDFSAFLAHVGPRPSGEYSIERTNNSKGYEPGNVRWATLVEQANNKRNSCRLTARGQTKTLPEWAREVEPITGVGKAHIWARLILGWPPESAIFEPLRYRMGHGMPKGTRARKRREAIKRATPRWLTKDQRQAMLAVRREAQELDASVDHIEPIQGRLAWGLHVPWNLQILPLHKNTAKGTRNQLA